MMLLFDVHVSNITFDREFVKATRDAKQELINGAYQILQDSQALVPVATGALKQSGEVFEYGDAIYIQYGDDVIGAGGLPSRDYALDQHENRFYAHRNGGQAKYLEEPFIARWNEIQAQVINRFVRSLNGAA